MIRLRYVPSNAFVFNTLINFVSRNVLDSVSALPSTTHLPTILTELYTPFFLDSNYSGPSAGHVLRNGR